MRLLAFGEILWDVFEDARHIGGATLNIAAHFSLHGGASFIISALGDDELGKDALRITRDFGINDSFITIHKDMPTGESIVALTNEGIPTYRITENVAYDYIKTDSVLTKEEDVLYFGTLALRGEHNRKALTSLIYRADFSEIFADVNLRAPFIFKDSILIALQHATILKISDEELPTLSTLALGAEYDYKKAAKILGSNFDNLKIIIITRGDKGAYLLNTQDGKEYEIAAKKTSVASTVGAGDSFSASFLYHYTKGESIENCLDYATRVSSFVVSVPEAVPKYDPMKL